MDAKNTTLSKTLAIEWWNTLSEFEKSMATNSIFGLERSYSTLTDIQIESIHRDFTRNNSK